MASPLRTGKQSVDLSAPARVSRIRRNPPPPAKSISVEDQKERDRRAAYIGIPVFTLALLIILLGASHAAGWSPSGYSIRINV